MQSKEVKLVQTNDGFPEQYDAYDAENRIIGYIRLRWGYFSVTCPDCEGEEVLCDSSVNGWGFFNSNSARKKSLRKAKAQIAAWCNKHPGVYGEP